MPTDSYYHVLPPSWEAVTSFSRDRGERARAITPSRGYTVTLLASQCRDAQDASDGEFYKQQVLSREVYHEIVVVSDWSVICEVCCSSPGPGTSMGGYIRTEEPVATVTANATLIKGLIRRLIAMHLHRHELGSLSIVWGSRGAMSAQINWRDTLILEDCSRVAPKATDTVTQRLWRREVS